MEMSVTIYSGLPITPSPKGMFPLPRVPDRGRDAWYKPHHEWDACTPLEERDVYTTLLYLAKDAG